MNWTCQICGLYQTPPPDCVTSAEHAWRCAVLNCGTCKTVTVHVPRPVPTSWFVPSGPHHLRDVDHAAECGIDYDLTTQWASYIDDCTCMECLWRVVGRGGKATRQMEHLIRLEIDKAKQIRAGLKCALNAWQELLDDDANRRRGQDTVTHPHIEELRKLVSE